MHDSSGSFLSCYNGQANFWSVVSFSNQNRCIGNSKADECDDLPDFCRTLIGRKT